jgi:hypothetical protein
MPDPQATVMDMIFGRWRSQILYAGVKVGIFDALSDGTKASPALAEELGLDPVLCYRLLRALASIELLQEDADRNFTLTATGDLLRQNHPQTLRGVTLLEEGPEHYALWKHLPAMVHDGKQNAFLREFGQMAFEHAAHNPAYGNVFNEAMTSYSSSQSGWALDALDDCDFSSITHLCDVGGGHGHLVCSFLAKYPHLKGTVFELPSTIENNAVLWAGKFNVSDRCAYVPGDMFTTVPTADAYMMKMILHDWNDEECIQILRNISVAASPGGRVFIIEHIIPPPGTPHFAKLFDIHMMCWGTGRERTLEEYTALLERAGWKYVRAWFPRSGTIGAVEGIMA